jgi:hypothetical protein
MQLHKRLLVASALVQAALRDGAEEQGGDPLPPRSQTALRTFVASTLHSELSQVWLFLREKPDRIGSSRAPEAKMSAGGHNLGTVKKASTPAQPPGIQPVLRHSPSP